MKRRVRRHPAVANDIISNASCISQRSLAIALRFIDATEVTLKWLAQHPGEGSLRDFDDPRLASVRSWPVKGLRNHLILYEVDARGFFILAVMHGARDLPRALEDRVT